MSNSVLNVTRLYGGSNPRQVYIYARFEPLADFEMTALVGWDEAEFQKLSVSVYRNLDPPGVFEGIGGFVYETNPAVTSGVSHEGLVS